MKTTPHILTTMKKTPLLAAALLGLVMNDRAFAGADNFANATDMTTNNWPSVVSLTTFTSQAGEPGHRPNGTNGAQKSAWWKWTAPVDGFCTVDTIGQFDDQHIYDTVLAVYTGSAVNALTRVAVNDDHDSHLGYGSANSASVTFYATQGTTYHFAVDGRSPASVNAGNHKAQIRLRQLRSRAEQRVGVFGIPEEEFMHGMILLNKTAGHAYSGKLILTGKSYPFKGVFGLDGYSSFSIERKVPKGAAPQPPLTILLDGTQCFVGGAPYTEFAIISHLLDGAWWGRMETRQTYAKGTESGLKGRYSAAISAFDNVWKSGVTSFTATGAGVVKGASVLPDGTKTTFGSFLCENDASSSWVPVYNGLYKNAGYFTSTMKITEAGATDQVTSASLFGRHHRPEAPGSVFMPNGVTFYTGVEIKGSTYTPPAAKTRALGFLDGMMGAGKLSIPMASGEIDAITENLTFDAANKFIFASKTRKPVLSLNKSTGIATGYILDDAGKKRSLTGVLFMDGMTPKLHGHVSGTTRNVFFEVIP